MTQENLFENAKNERRLVLSSNFSVYPLFSRGVLLPPLIEAGAEYDFPEPHGSSFVEFPGAIPEAIVADYSTAARNLVPIGIVIKPVANDVSPYRRRDAILLAEVAKLLFRSEKEMRRFALAQFADVDMSSLAVEMSVDSDAFTGEIKAQETIGRTDQAALNPSQSERRARRADAFAGVCCALLHDARGTTSWFDFLATFLNGLDHRPEDKELARYWTAAACCAATNSSFGNDWQTALLTIVAKTLLKQDPSRGWTAKSLLSSIEQDAAVVLKKSGYYDEFERLRNWSEKTRRILDDEIAMPALSDEGEGNVVLNGLLLLLVRGSCESLVALREGSNQERVGPQVWRLAFAMASLHEGLRGMPKEVKYSGSPEAARSRMEALGLAALRCGWPEGNEADRMSAIQTEVEEIEEDGRSVLALSFSDITIATRQLEENQALKKARSDCRYYGFEVSKIGTDHFDVSAGPEQHLEGQIQVSVWNDPTTGSEVLRFKSIAKELSTKSSSAKSDPVKFLENSRLLSKSNLIALLFSNADAEQNCRVALQTDPLAVVVLADQMLDTMDRDECVAHLRNVSKKAKELSAIL